MVPAEAGRLLEISRLVAGIFCVGQMEDVAGISRGASQKLGSVLFIIKTFLQFLLPAAISCVRLPKVNPLGSFPSLEPQPCLGLALVLGHVFLSLS